MVGVLDEAEVDMEKSASGKKNAQTLTTMERLEREEAVQNNKKTVKRSKPRGSCRY